ncbi:type II toxin-antitoxin system VapC family toxin [Cellulomonas fengjieae]|uniref:Type II toxin-antitoxin system VapC family toxin n=1 Tax=Cellulomonas fengjieae TaxID=2819978 RepID=A0ABS3SKG6_9CELL|nr:type II toxin-antitoxin system VapC family toxin [Cellulomonas fengjieae]MBO3086244.1 type II toxin-antitoxin system VapC family toxin [Cellulomonas fengjieae]QVI65710.1 type II toxin-antitoxin system VapC family toxin [Cellulomonas fengjieae]
MTRFVVDAGAALRLARTDTRVPAAHELLAPTLLRSQALSAMHEAAHRGELSPAVARDQLARLNRLKIRLLGDAVLRQVAWRIADDLGWESTYAAEYVALTRLQADYLVTLDEDLARAVEGVVPTAPFEALLDPTA